MNTTDSGGGQSPWHEAYEKLKAFVAAGATPEDVTEFARLLKRDLPSPVSPEDHALFAQVQAQAITDSQEREPDEC